jgi:hypothetical protein
MFSANEKSCSRCHPNSFMLSAISVMPQAVHSHIDLLPSSTATHTCISSVPVRCSTCSYTRYTRWNYNCVRSCMSVPIAHVRVFLRAHIIYNIHHCTQSSRATWKIIVSNSIAQSIQLTKNNQSRCMHPCSHHNPCTRSHTVISRYAKKQVELQKERQQKNALHCTAPHCMQCLPTHQSITSSTPTRI